MSKTNCCNCGAALDIFASKCNYCGTKNINMTELDLASGEAANFIFKLPTTPSIKGNVYMSILAIPELQTITTTSNNINVTSGKNNVLLASYPVEYSLDMNINLRAVPKKDNTLYHLTNHKN